MKREDKTVAGMTHQQRADYYASKAERLANWAMKLAIIAAGLGVLGIVLRALGH